MEQRGSQQQRTPRAPRQFRIARSSAPYQHSNRGDQQPNAKAKHHSQRAPTRDHGHRRTRAPRPSCAFSLPQIWSSVASLAGAPKPFGETSVQTDPPGRSAKHVLVSPDNTFVCIAGDDFWVAQSLVSSCRPRKSQSIVRSIAIASVPEGQPFGLSGTPPRDSEAIANFSLLLVCDGTSIKCYNLDFDNSGEDEVQLKYNGISEFTSPSTLTTKDDFIVVFDKSIGYVMRTEMIDHVLELSLVSTLHPCDADDWPQTDVASMDKNTVIALSGQNSAVWSLDSVPNASSDNSLQDPPQISAVSLPPFLPENDSVNEIRPFDNSWLLLSTSGKLFRYSRSRQQMTSVVIEPEIDHMLTFGVVPPCSVLERETPRRGKTFKRQSAADDSQEKDGDSRGWENSAVALVPLAQPQTVYFGRLSEQPKGSKAEGLIEGDEMLEEGTEAATAGPDNEDNGSTSKHSSPQVCNLTTYQSFLTASPIQTLGTATPDTLVVVGQKESSLLVLDG